MRKLWLPPGPIIYVALGSSSLSGSGRHSEFSTGYYVLDFMHIVRYIYGCIWTYDIYLSRLCWVPSPCRIICGSSLWIVQQMPRCHVPEGCHELCQSKRTQRKGIRGARELGEEKAE